MRRTYSDESFSFCLQDGSLLSPPDSDGTLVLRNRWLDSTLEDLPSEATLKKRRLPLPKAPGLNTKGNQSVVQPNSQLRMVERFWKGFQSEIQDDRALTLNKPSIPSNPSGKSAMSKTISGFKISVQIHPSQNTADVNITVTSSQFFYFAKLHKRRNHIQTDLPDGVEWKLNREGESWIILRRNFTLTKQDEWKTIYRWFKLNLRRFHKVFFPRLDALKRRHPSPP